MENIMLVFGGKSFEHDISIITALIVNNRYKAGKYKLLPVYIDKENKWHCYLKNNLNSKMFKDFEKTYKVNGFCDCFLKTGENNLYVKNGLITKKIKIAGAINCCHGGIGESGILYSILAGSNIPSTAGNHTALGICMDKLLSKYCFNGLKLPNISYIKVSKNSWQTNTADILKQVSKLGFPVILKPTSLGSSIGISVAKNADEFKKSILLAFEFDSQVLVEKAILDKMVEYNVACLKRDGKVIVSEVDKPIRSDEILSFKDKYIGDKPLSKNGKMPQKNPPQKGGGYISENKNFNFNIDEKLKTKLKEISKKVYEEIGLFGPARIDFIVDKKGSVFLNEINTIPGSLAYYFFIPKLFKNMNEYIDAIVDESIKIFKCESNIKKEYITNLFN